MQDHTKLNLMWIDDELYQPLRERVASEGIPVITLTSDITDEILIDRVKPHLDKTMTVVSYLGSSHPTIKDRFNEVVRKVEQLPIYCAIVEGELDIGGYLLLTPQPTK